MNLNFLKGDCHRNKPAKNHPWRRVMYPASIRKYRDLTGATHKEPPVRRIARSGVSAKV